MQNYRLQPLMVLLTDIKEQEWDNVDNKQTEERAILNQYESQESNGFLSDDNEQEQIENGKNIPVIHL